MDDPTNVKFPATCIAQKNEEKKINCILNIVASPTCFQIIGQRVTFLHSTEKNQISVQIQSIQIILICEIPTSLPLNHI